jgi:hypothetical protein
MSILELVINHIAGSYHDGDQGDPDLIVGTISACVSLINTHE